MKKGSKKIIGILIALLIVAALVFGFVKGYMYSVAGFKIHATWVLLATVVTLAITWVNIRGIKAAAVFQTILTVTIALVGILLVAASAFRGSPANLEGQWMVGGDALNRSSASRAPAAVVTVAPAWFSEYSSTSRPSASSSTSSTDIPARGRGVLMQGRPGIP